MKPYSYHTFIFPFVWNDGGKVSQKMFRKCIGDFWKPETLESDAKDPKMKKEIYNQYHYFNPAARNAIYMREGDPKPIVETYTCDFDIFFKTGKINKWNNTPRFADNPYKYRIRKNFYNYDGSVKESFDARLCINEIKLKLFNTGIGMIIFELENYEFPNPEAINQINDFGRRIYKAHIGKRKSLSDDLWYCNTAADSIEILNIRDAQTEESLIQVQLNDIPVEDPLSSEMSSLLLKFLSNGSYSVTTDPNEKGRKKFYIESIIDDRMFVACFYTNRAFVSHVKEFCAEDYRYLADAINYEPGHEENMARKWYQFVFVDGEWPSCYSRTMMQTMLKDHTYDRWVELGTITGVSEYSLVSACDDEEDYYDLDSPFLTMYLEMAILVLAQRATLLSFERRISEASCRRQDIRKVQKDYIMFQSQLLLQEVTPQQQGIEIYDLLLKNLYISKLKSDIEKQIEALFALENYSSDQCDNRILFVLAVFAIFDVIDYFQGMEHWKEWILPVSLVVGIIIIWGFFRRKSRK